MSLKTTDVRTLGDEAIAKKFKLSLAKVRQLVKQGAEHEKEHNTNLAKAEQVARDHIAERPDYYKMLKKAEKTPVSMKEESGVGGVRGLGYVTGDPSGTNFVDKYINTNAMSYNDENGNKLEYNKKNHKKYHKLSFNDFDPTNIDKAKNFVNEGISAGPERSSDYSIGDAGGGRTLYRKQDMEEDFAKIKKKLSKAAKVGSVVGAMGAHAGKVYDVGNVVSHHDDPGLATATAVSYLHPASRMLQAAPTVLKVDKAGKGENEFKRQKLYGGKKLQMKEDKDPCWKGYEMVGMKKKGGRKVPNCVPVKESGQVMSRYTERPTYENKSMGQTLPRVGGIERGIYEDGRILRSLRDKDHEPQPTPAYAKKIEQEKHDKQRKKINRANSVHMKMYMRTGDKKWLHGMKEETQTEGYASIGHAYDWAGDVNPKTKFYGDKPKATTTKNDEKDDTYNNSNKGKKVKFAKTVKEDWQSVNRKDKTSGLSQKAVDAYRRENPGSKLQTAVTEKNPSGKRAARRKSFCSRMGGMKKRLTSAKTARDPDSNINKALRRWNCEESVMNELKAETLGSYIKKASASRKKALKGSKPDLKTWGKRHKGITTAIHKLTREETMDARDQIQEAIYNILDENLVEMKENFVAALQEKAMEKLEERKKEIAANYFAQD